MMRQFERPKYCFMNKTCPGVCKLKITNFSVVYFFPSLFSIEWASPRATNNNITPVVRLREWKQNNARKKNYASEQLEIYLVKPSSSFWRVMIQTMAKVKMILIYRDRIRKKNNTNAKHQMSFGFVWELLPSIL